MGWQPNGSPGSGFVEIDPLLEPLFGSSGNFTLQPDSAGNYYYSGDLSNYGGTPAQNDFVTFFPRFIPAGVYTLAIAGFSYEPSAIHTVQLSEDGTHWRTIAAIDFYSPDPATLNYVVLTAADIAIPAGMYYVRVIALTRNAAATDWELDLSRLALTKTG